MVYGMYKDPHGGRRFAIGLIVVTTLILIGGLAMGRASNVAQLFLILAVVGVVAGAVLWHLTKP